MFAPPADNYYTQHTLNKNAYDKKYNDAVSLKITVTVAVLVQHSSLVTVSVYEVVLVGESVL